ncbi:MAG TPA: Rrf2 family transcriptional regulator [Phycisphaerae bacterium]|nr:Rrf2 family transcriptional regulator [Phycisphaerae bacterium]
MSNLLRISEAASLSMHATVLLAASPDRALTTSQIATVLGVSEAHLSKVLQRLGRAGLVRSTRGPKGGFSLTRPSDQVTLLEVYEAIEGVVVPANCLFDTAMCRSDKCILGGLVGEVNDRVRDYLARTKLSDLTDVVGGLIAAAVGEADEGQRGL